MTRHQPFIEKQHRLSEPVVTAGTRVYAISSQNGLFPDSWGGHVPQEMWGIWDHPIKLFDGVWFGVRGLGSPATRWLSESKLCRVGLGWTEYEYQLGPLRITRRDCVPDGVEGMISNLHIVAAGADPPQLELVALARSDLRPAWLGERAGMRDHPDRARLGAADGSVVFTDAGNPWTAVFGATTPAKMGRQARDLWAVQQTEGTGVSAELVYPLILDADGRADFTFILAGSTESEAAAVATYRRLKRAHAKLVAGKLALCQAIAKTSAVRTPDPLINDALLWTKLDCQMLAREVPPYGTGAGAGLPVYPWWFGIDSVYAALPMLQAGLFELTRDTLVMLKRVSVETNRDEPGRVIHELATTGVVFNHGNLVETPAFVRAVHQYWLWTGDQAFLEEMYPFCKQGLLDYTLGRNDPDGDLCPSGRSIIETLEMHAGFECIDVASYTWDALRRLADMAPAAGDAELAPALLAKAETLGQRLREEWWLEDEGLFADVRATPAEVRDALERIEAWASKDDVHPDVRRQAEQARALFGPELQMEPAETADAERHWLLRHWVVLCPVEVGVATAAQAARLVQRLRSEEWSNEWGLCLHPERRTSMSISAGMLGLAAARYGHTETALAVVRRLAESLPYGMPGAISESLPDAWCFIQLWSALGVISPVMENFLGIAPRAAERRLRVVPNLPSAWEHAGVDDLRVGDTHFTVLARRNHTSYTVEIKGEGSQYAIEAGCYPPHGTAVEAALWNDVPVAWSSEMTTAGECVVCDVSGFGTLHIQWKATR